jgi:hypothetical protein
MPYGGDLENSDLDKIRFWLGDTDPTNELITDAEINSLLATMSARAAAAQIAHSLAARYARKADKQIGDLRISWSQLSKQFASLATSLSVASTTAQSVWAGGLSKAEKAETRADADMVQHSFTRGLHAHPETENF